jgi:hypothetical protein
VHMKLYNVDHIKSRVGQRSPVKVRKTYTVINTTREDQSTKRLRRTELVVIVELSGMFFNDSQQPSNGRGSTRRNFCSIR